MTCGSVSSAPVMIRIFQVPFCVFTLALIAIIHNSYSGSIMAQKRPLDDANYTAMGYIHETSPVKRSAKNTDYFNSTLQTGAKNYQRVVCFSKKLHQDFKNAEEKRSPVKITNAATSKNIQDPSKVDTKMLYKSSMENYETPLMFTHQAPTASPVNMDTTVTEFVLGVPSSEPRKINLSGHITKIVEQEETITTSYGREVRRQTFALADERKVVSLTVWGSLINEITLGNTYSFTNLSISTFNDVKHLQTTPTTTVVPLDKMANPCEEEPVHGNSTVLKQASCDSVECQMTKSCKSCKQIIGTDHLFKPTFKCPGCNMRQRSTGVINQVKVKLNVTSSGLQYRLTAYNTATQDFFENAGKNFVDSDQMEEYFLSIQFLDITFNSQFQVTKMSLSA